MQPLALLKDFLSFRLPSLGSRAWRATGGRLLQMAEEEAMEVNDKVSVWFGTMWGL